jgi:hypothetical protein
MSTPHTNSPPRPSLWTRLRAAWATLLGRPAAHTAAPQHAHAELVDTAPSPLEPTSPSSPQGQRRDVQPYNPQALPAAREQWQRGDWASLAALTLEDLQDPPDRAKLALLAAAGHMQLGRQDLGADCLRQAKAWGCNPQLMRQIVIAGVHNTLGKAAALADMPDRAEQHFAASLRTVMPMHSGKHQIEQRRHTQMQPLELN